MKHAKCLAALFLILLLAIPIGTAEVDRNSDSYKRMEEAVFGSVPHPLEDWAESVTGSELDEGNTREIPNLRYGGVIYVMPDALEVGYGFGTGPVYRFPYATQGGGLLDFTARFGLAGALAEVIRSNPTRWFGDFGRVFLNSDANSVDFMKVVIGVPTDDGSLLYILETNTTATAFNLTTTALN